MRVLSRLHESYHCMGCGRALVFSVARSHKTLNPDDLAIAECKHHGCSYFEVKLFIPVRTEWLEVERVND